MRILFTCYPERTHFLLMAPLAWALRSAGHDVRVACQPKMTAAINQAGLTAVPVGSDRDLWQVHGRLDNEGARKAPGLLSPYDAMEKSPEDIDLETLRDGYRVRVASTHKMTNAPLTAALVEYARQWRPELVVWEPMTYAGAIAAQAVGAAHCRLLVGADVYGVTRAHFNRLAADAADGGSDPLGEWLGGYARQYGGEFTEELVTGQFSIDLLPPSLQVHAPGLDYRPMRFTPYGGPAVVPRWLWEPPTRPRVALTLGLTVTDHAIGFPIDVEEILEAVADLDIELVATVGEAAQRKLKRVPDNARLVSYVPMQALLPTCSAVIHHAGVGTLSTAAFYGVPQLALPWDVDQPMLSERLAAQGAGLTTHSAKATGQIVRESLQRLLDERTFRDRAKDLRSEILAMPHAGDLVPELENMAAAALR
ncbi:glycosyl transferase [Streptomyces lunaelactis]|uniref:Glycosyl transferase n=1 Tax=Streptomyces lunaelactis TaxID=1535768 RepID=A0A2R4T1S1_9ACTN|nr:activator-dependent family glycosyltransferase [Streptomyces lunaelactis]AVZ73085.1 glycosyl transferase [Streptomyces lunaelactis]NUK01329.1 activator-dependent family glycosyltransferase [Streptomyces lunaelactis]NUK15560.1 activator-dependent family glycosyltransferase [Streptomyces lunaelactis]NUK41777.1 activator-dependent family glycosyltransferase [Streptomyces lunaelactis]NUK84781.1 activator-dependent family glycosyltransferase [Streptomyces lunaelactis]